MSKASPPRVRGLSCIPEDGSFPGHYPGHLKHIFRRLYRIRSCRPAPGAMFCCNLIPGQGGQLCRYIRRVAWDHRIQGVSPVCLFHKGCIFTQLFPAEFQDPAGIRIAVMIGIQTGLPVQPASVFVRGSSSLVDGGEIPCMPFPGSGPVSPHHNSFLMLQLLKGLGICHFNPCMCQNPSCAFYNMLRPLRGEMSSLP